MANNTTSTVQSAALSQVFTVKAPTGISGIYTPSMDLFFRTKSSSFGIVVQIVNVTNGLPDPTQPIPNATARLTADQINTSTNGTVATNFPFSGLVYLKTGTSYAFIVSSLGNSSDYQLWTSIIGDTDLSTGIAVSSNPLSGDAYYAKNSSNWGSIPNEDLKYTIYRCKFDIADPAVAMLHKSNTDILWINNIQYSTGEPEIQSGDEVYALTSDGNYANTQIYGRVQKYLSGPQFLYVTNSTGLFAANQQVAIVRNTSEQGNLYNAGLLALATINKVVDISTHGIATKIGDDSASLANIGFKYRGTVKGTGGGYSKEASNSSYQAFSNQKELEFSDATRYTLSYSNEKSLLAGNSSLDIEITFSSNTDFISPVVDMNEHSAIIIRNVINSNTQGEEGEYGGAYTRYISETVTLVDGMDAETINTWVTCFKPPGTEVYVYGKFWNAEDPDSFDSKPWTKLVQLTDANLYSDPKNFSDYREYQYSLPTVPASDGSVWQPTDGAGDQSPAQYVTSSGMFISFKSFALKIVLAVDDDESAYIYPRINDLRAIASML